MNATTLEKTVESDTYPEPASTERCDRCGAQAYMRIYKDDVQRLLLCAHHGRHHSPALVNTGHVVLDYSYLLSPVD